MKRRRGAKADPEIQERRQKAITLRKQGYELRAIAEQLGVSVGTAFNDVAGFLESIRMQDMAFWQTWKLVELERLDTLWSKLWAKGLKGDLQAIHGLLKISDMRCRLLGLYEYVDSRKQAREMLQSEIRAILEYFEKTLSREAYKEVSAALSKLNPDMLEQRRYFRGSFLALTNCLE